MLFIVCFASAMACAMAQHQLYPGDPGYQAGYQGGAPSYQGAPASYQGAPAPYHGGPAGYQAPAQAGPITATNYQTGDGHQRSESRDNEGNVRGQYSYVDPNGKTITVKYTAGKDGFQVEGDHLPRAPVPQSPVAGPQSQGQYNAYQQSQPQQYQPQQYQAQQYRPQPQQYQPQPQQYQAQPQQYQAQNRAPHQFPAQQSQTLANFPQARQHRFTNSPSVAGVSVNVDPSGGGAYNYQFNL